jgi:membrane-associated phospholipid phosphatase
VTRTRDHRHLTAVIGLELAAGIALLGAATLAGIAFVHRPWENRLDVWGYAVLPPAQNSRLFHDIAALGSLPAVVIVVVLAISISIWRDVARAIACALGPLSAVLITEHVAKPLVGRHALLGGYSYPSGTVTAVAALAVVVLLASPRLLRPLAALVGIGATAAVSAAVIAMRWHYATDALGGAYVGSGAVFTLDALFHLPALWRSSRAAATPRRSRGELPHLLERV